MHVLTRSGTCKRCRNWSSALSQSILAAVLLAHGWSAIAEEPLKLSADLPEGQAIVGGKFGGYYFAAKSLQEEYDKFLKQVDILRGEIRRGELTGREASERVRMLEGELRKVRETIESTKQLVSIGTVSTQTETFEFELGAEKLLFLANIAKVRLIGWDGPGVKCVLAKTVVTDGKDPDKQLAAIRLVHRHGPAPEDVGRSPEEREADFQKMLATPDGQKLTAEKVEQIRASWKRILGDRYFGAFQGKPIDTLRIEGLTYQEGNQHVQFEVLSKNGDGRAGSMWQRDASLTVYVPACTAVGVRGGSGGFTAEDLHTTLLVRGIGDRDYNSRSHIKNHEGPLTIENIALDGLEKVKGDVQITLTADIGNTSTGYSGGQISLSSELPRSYVYRDIEGDFTARLLRVNLKLSGVRGLVDVMNDFGDTELVVSEPLASGVHQVFSQSGNIQLRLSKDALDKAPLLAVTECGTVRSRRDGPPLKDGNISFWTEDTRTPLTYRGFATKSVSESPFGRFNRLRPDAGSLEAPGLDVINRAGTIEIGPLEE